MKRTLPLLMLLALLAGCGEQTLTRAEELQQRYGQLAGYEAEVRAAVVREDETIVYTLRLCAEGDSVRAEVVAPEELAGIAATMTGEELTLNFDGMLLDASTDVARVSALSCAPLLLSSFPEAYLAHCGTEELSGVEALRADFSLTLGEETLGCALWFGAEDAPLYGEVAREGKIIAAVEFTRFTFGDIIPSGA